MLGEIEPETLMLYQTFLTDTAKRVGSEHWGLVYQADHRARLEHLERIYRRGMEEYNRRKDAKIPFDDFDVEHPWDWCFRELVENEVRFWWLELEQPSLFHGQRKGSGSASMAIGGDAPVAGGGQA